MKTWLANNPGAVLGILAGLTALAGAIESAARHRRKRALRQLATARRMNFSACDRLRIAPRIAASFPISGAADLYVTDVVYGSDGATYHYVFTAEYTVGVVRGKHRELRVATFSEPKDRQREPVAPSAVRLADGTLPLIEQYRSLTIERMPAA